MFRTFTLLAAAAVCSTQLPATVIVHVGQPDIAGAPGSTIGWDFAITSTDYILTVANVALLPDAPFGTFQDTLSTRTGFTVGPSAIGHGEVYGSNSGLASFTIDAGTAPGSVHNGTIYVVYNLYAVDPFSSLFEPLNPAHTISEGNLVEIPASITVTAAPEPGTLLTMGVFCLVGSVWMKRRARGQDAFSRHSAEQKNFVSPPF